MTGRRRRLVEFGFALGNLRERHRGVATLEGDLRGGAQILVAIEDVLQVQSGHREKRLRIGAVSQAMHAVVASTMANVAFIVANHCCEVADLECFMCHKRRILPPPIGREAWQF